ncbi:MAG: XRE family transcriptional regulator [Vicinamibacterales bacterium]
MNDPRRIEVALARNLREWRGRRGWTLAELARRAGLSKGMLVQIEQCQTNPSIATLCKLANALGIALPRLVESSAEPEVRRVAADEVAWLWQGRARGSRAGLLAGIDGPIPVELWDWRVGARDGYDAVAHPPGTREVLHVLDGALTVSVEGVEVTLGTGESAVFRADRPHRYAASGRGGTRFLMVVVEPIPVPSADSPAAAGQRARRAPRRRDVGPARAQRD